MSKKLKQMNMHKFYAIMQLLQDNLDDLQPTTPHMLKLQSDLAQMCELLNDQVANTYTIQKSTYFNELVNKIDTVVRKHFNPEM